MKVFTGNDGKIWQNKVNFVDDNNVVLGFDNTSQCCESFGWYVSESKNAESGKGGDEYDKQSVEFLAPYNFDVSYSVSSNDDNEHYDYEFKLVAKGLPDLYLTLYNEHNGYYSHGFTMTADNKKIYSGSL